MHFTTHPIWTRMIKEDPMYHLRGEEYDTSLHLLGRCSALVGTRRKQFGKHIRVQTELRLENWSTLLKFAKNSQEVQVT